MALVYSVLLVPLLADYSAGFPPRGLRTPTYSEGEYQTSAHWVVNWSGRDIVVFQASIRVHLLFPGIGSRRREYFHEKEPPASLSRMLDVFALGTYTRN